MITKWNELENTLTYTLGETCLSLFTIVAYCIAAQKKIITTIAFNLCTQSKVCLS